MGLDLATVRRCFAPAMLGLLLLAASAAFIPARAAALNPSAERTVRAGTFEVVQLKPSEGAVQYDRPLPLDLIPFQERVDKYRSIGTAFALGHNRYVTASHVLMVGLGSQFGPPALRDTAGNVYAIDRVLKYSNRQDFAVFSLVREPPGVKPLPIGPAPALNDAVFAVGNALGEGIVVRDGLYTSETPEELNGDWKWLRFSAAASPGNSGGPLVDQRGRVIGVVLRKTEAENLNYALPMQHHTIEGLTVQHVQQAQIRLITDNAARLFPSGSGSEQLLHETPASPLPRFIRENQDGVWGVMNMQPQVSQLNDNGFLRIAGPVIRLRAPDNIALAQLYGDSKLLMDLVLKGYALRRQVGSESVKVTSLGPAQEQGTYTDRYERTWQIRSWAVPYDDMALTALCLPTPEGYDLMLVQAQTGYRELIVHQQELLADYLYLTFTGTLSRWHDYLALPATRPAVFTGLTLDVDPGKSVHFHSHRFDLRVTSDLVPLSPDSVLAMDLSFYRDGASVLWDVSGLTVAQSAQQSNWVQVQRLSAPVASMPEEFQSSWRKMQTHEYPYDATVFTNNGNSIIRAPGAAATASQPSVQYVLTVRAEGDQPQQAMSPKLALLQRSFQQLEH